KPLGTPEAAEAEIRDLEMVGIRTLQGPIRYMMPGRCGQRFRPAGQRLYRLGQLELPVQHVAQEKHRLFLSAGLEAAASLEHEAPLWLRSPASQRQKQRQDRHDY